MLQPKKYRGPKKLGYDNYEAVRQALIEFCIYVFFLLVTTIVALSTHHIYMYHFNRTMYDMFLSTDLKMFHKDSVLFDQIVTTSDWWNFLQFTVLPELHGMVGKKVDNVDEEEDAKEEDAKEEDAKQKDAKEENANEEDASEEAAKEADTDAAAEAEAQTADDDGVSTEEIKLLRENLLLGPPRLRQIRVLKDSCDVHQAFQRYFDTCYAEYSSGLEDKIDEFKGTQYHTMSELGSMAVWGKVNTYYGAGFVKDLTYVHEDNDAIIRELKQAEWIDRGTRIVMFEFTLYNANTELFDSVKFIGEIPPTGGVIPSYKIQAVKVYSLWTEKDYFIVMCAVLFYGLIIYYAFEELMDVMRMGIVNYMRSCWNLVDFFVVVMGFVSFFYNIWHSLYLKTILQKIVDQPEKYQTLDVICYWNMLYIDMMGVLAFLIWIKVFKYISFNKTLLQFSNTFQRCAKDLFGFGVMFTIVFLAYALLGLLLFGTRHPRFQNFTTSFLTMTRMVLGDFDYAAIEDANRILGPIFFLSFTMLIFFILLNMFLAIIAETYSQVKSEITRGQNQMLPFVREKLAQLFACLHIKKDRFANKKSEHFDKQRAIEQEKTDKDSASIIDIISDDLSDTTPYPNDTSTTERSSRVLPTRVRKSEIFKEFFEEVDAPPDYENVKRLTRRIVLLEDVMEQLITNLDHILKEVASKKRSKR